MKLCFLPIFVLGFFPMSLITGIPESPDYDIGPTYYTVVGGTFLLGSNVFFGGTVQTYLVDSVEGGAIFDPIQSSYDVYAGLKYKEGFLKVGFFSSHPGKPWQYVLRDDTFIDMRKMKIEVGWGSSPTP